MDKLVEVGYVEDEDGENRMVCIQIPPSSTGRFEMTGEQVRTLIASLKRTLLMVEEGKRLQ